MGFTGKVIVGNGYISAPYVPALEYYKVLPPVVEKNKDKWYRVRVFSVEIVEWIRGQNFELWNYEDPGWYEQVQNDDNGIKFLLHEKLYLLFTLKWS